MDITAMLSSQAMPNIEALSMHMATNKTQEAFGTALLAESLDTFEANGQALRSMMELSVDPTIGSNFDMSV